MKKIIAILLIFFLQIGSTYCLSEQINSEHNHAVSENFDHHKSHGHNETEHGENEPTCCTNFNLIYSDISRIFLEKNGRYHFTRDDIPFFSMPNILSFYKYNPIGLINYTIPRSIYPKKFYRFVFANHAPPPTLAT